jgi:DNA primase
MLLTHNLNSYLNKNILLTDLCRYYNIGLELHGNKFFAYCPFHEDSALSFVIFPKENLWKCRCGKGNIINFVMKIEGISFKNAVKKIEHLILERTH